MGYQNTEGSEFKDTTLTAPEGGEAGKKGEEEWVAHEAELIARYGGKKADNPPEA